jgi:hypothetical protein
MLRSRLVLGLLVVASAIAASLTGGTPWGP